MRVSSNPFQNVKTVHLSKLQIQQHQPGQRKSFPICIRPHTHQVVNGVFTTFYEVPRIRYARSCQGSPNKQLVILIVLNYENLGVLVH